MFFYPKHDVSMKHEKLLQLGTEKGDPHAMGQGNQELWGWLFWLGFFFTKNIKGDKYIGNRMPI